MLSYTGILTVEAQDTLGTFRNTPIVRTTRSSLSLVLSIPTEVTVTTNLTVYASATLMAAITFQEYDLTKNILSINLTTSLNYPYAVGGIVPSSPYDGEGVIDTYLGANFDCAGDGSDGGNGCFQVHSFTFDFSETFFLCDVSGTYIFMIDIECDPDLNPCTFTGMTEEIDAMLTVTNVDQTNSICGTVTVDGQVTGQLDTYSDVNFSVPQLVYETGETAYFEVTITADVTVSSVSLVNVYANDAGNIVNILQAGSLVDNNVGFDNSYSSSANTNRFSFVLGIGSNDLFNSGADVIVFELGVDVLVSYQTTFSKRDYVTEKVSLSQKVVVNNQIVKSNGNTDSASSICYGVTPFAVATGAWLLNRN